MAFIGNLQGPRQSETFSQLDGSFFGITGAQLAIEVDEYIADEASEEVIPVHLDDEGKLYLRVNAPQGGTQKLYLGLEKFTGKIKVVPDDSGGRVEEIEVEDLKQQIASMGQ